MAEREVVLITGAGGFIGGWVAETLHLSGAAHVHAGIRRWSSAARLGRFPLEIALCDLLDKEQVARAMTGTARVVHCVTGPGDVIVQGTENMLEAALTAGVRRFVHLSTTEVYGEVSGQIDESWPCQYTGSEYGDSKIEAEKLCWKFHERGLPVAVLRPSIVYGPFSTDWTVRLAQKLQSGNWGLYEGYGEGICNLIYIADLVSGILLAARHESAIGQAFNLCGPEAITWNEYFQRFNQALGLPALGVIKPAGSTLRASLMGRARSVIKLALRYIGGPAQRIYQGFPAARSVMQRVEKTMRTTATPAELKLYGRRAQYLTSKAQSLLGYTPKHDVDAGLQRSVQWLSHQDLLS